MKRKLAAILSADAVGYSRLMEQDEGRTHDTLKAHLHVMGSQVEKHGGRVIAIHGDNLLAEFASVVDAVRCAVEIQKEIKERNEELPEASRMSFRIGINLGDVIEEEGNIFGDGVNVAARLESLADPGGICISRSVHDHVKGKLTVGYQSLGAHSVKNIAEPVQVHRIVPEPDAFGKAVGRAWYRLKQWQKVAVAIGMAILQVFLGLAVKKYIDHAGSSGMFSFLTEKTAMPLPDKPSIAVLPFENMTGDPRQEYFTDGFTEQIITSLSKIPALFVISRNSTFTYKGKPVKVQQVSKELGVRYVLEGSVQKTSGRIRINVQLIDAISGQHVWAESYDRDLKDIFGLQDEVILKIASAMSVNLTAGEQARAWAEGTKSLEAYLKLMQSREYFRKGNRESNALARRLAEEAIALDPKYANAYAKLGATHMVDVWLGTTRPKDSIAKAIEWTQKALAMNGSLADARSRLGTLYSWSGRHDEGIAEAERGVELDPNSAQANIELAMVLRYAGRSKEAIPVIQKALRLEPMAPDIHIQQLALAYFQTGDCKQAIAVGEKGLKRQPDHLVSHVIMAAVYGSCDREKEARQEAAEVLRINPKFTVESFTSVIPYKNPADRERTAQGLRKAGLP
ncbi:MAG: adenylyl cyclase class-3/4/guanylyl cyclase [Actinobacteria bacterium]|nr:adenylyl cyclase class-3/4/guanylyl cyclase [Actinomycetota bacterium]